MLHPQQNLKLIAFLIVCDKCVLGLPSSGHKLDVFQKPANTFMGSNHWIRPSMEQKIMYQQPRIMGTFN